MITLNNHSKLYSEKYEFVPQTVAQIPWGHNRLIITKAKNVKEALFYCNEILKNAWDRDTLEAELTEKMEKSAKN
ncbi:MAG: DUF1016 N-terminal domain-containing protein [Bacteroidales bacterium]|nr:DUF1016 N-terminal domain-containing protein [Bacteroidales bacterium]